MGIHAPPYFIKGVEIVSKFIHTNLFNNSPYKFYNGHCYRPTIRKQFKIMLYI